MTKNQQSTLAMAELCKWRAVRALKSLDFEAAEQFSEMADDYYRDLQELDTVIDLTKGGLK